MSETKKILKIEDLTVHYDTENGIVRAVNGINITLDHKEALGLVGETGAGKTTTALSMLRLIPDPPGRIVSGSIEIDGLDLMSKTESELEKIRARMLR